MSLGLKELAYRAYYVVCYRPSSFYDTLRYSNSRRRFNTYASHAFTVLLTWAGYAQKPRGWAWRTTIDLVSSDWLTSTFKSPYATFQSLWTSFCFLVAAVLLIQTLRRYCHQVHPLHSVIAVVSAQGECGVHLGFASKGKKVREIQDELVVLLREVADRRVPRIVLQSPLFLGSDWPTIRLPKILGAAGLADVPVSRTNDAHLSLFKSLAFALLVHSAGKWRGRKRTSRTLRWERCRVVAPRFSLELRR